MTFKEICELNRITRHAQAKLFHMTIAEQKRFIKNWQPCKDQHCYMCNPQEVKRVDPVDYNYPG